MLSLLNFDLMYANMLRNSRESRVRGTTIPTDAIVRELLLARGFEEIESRLVGTRRATGKDLSLDRHVAAYRRIVQRP